MRHFSVTASFAILMAVAFVLVGIRHPANRTHEKIGSLLFDGAAFGPLLLLFLSPFAELVGYQTDLFEEVVKGEATLLWLSVTYAGLNLLWKLR